MYKYDEKNNRLWATDGGIRAAGLPIRDSYVEILRGIRGVCYEPQQRGDKAQIGVVIIHAEDDYATFAIGPELAKRGYVTLCARVAQAKGPMDQKLQNVKSAIAFLKAMDGVKKVVLMGHSGGATLMTAYQRAAENGIASLRQPSLLYPTQLEEELPPADAIMLLDANMGNGAMSLFSVDPAVTEEGCGRKLDPALDVFNPANGYDPAGSHYSEAFLQTFFAAQRERNNRLIHQALERLHAIETGHGLYNDDEPFCVPGAAQYMFCNKILPQDTGIFAHTKGVYPLLHRDESVTQQVVRCLRRPFPGQNPTGQFHTAVFGSVRSYLSEHAVLALEDYRLAEDGVTGVDWFHTYNCPPGNVGAIRVPLLTMGMTGSYEYLTAEEIYKNAASGDKTIAFVEGAGHNFDPAVRCEETPGQFGDTQTVLFNYLDRWLSAPERGLL